MTDKLQDIADRLTKATGPDWELDEIIWAWCHGWSYPLFGAAVGDKRQHRDDGEKQDYTASVDAALALVEEKYPSLVITMRSTGGTIQITDVFNKEEDKLELPASALYAFDGKGGLPVLRVLMAALIAKESL